jgi:hypothetical protein
MKSKILSNEWNERGVQRKIFFLGNIQLEDTTGKS